MYEKINPETDVVREHLVCEESELREFAEWAACEGCLGREQCYYKWNGVCLFSDYREERADFLMQAIHNDAAFHAVISQIIGSCVTERE